MASRAQVFPNYSYGNEGPRQRRPVVFQTHDPVVLPRSRSWDINGALIAAAAAATLLVAGATYAVYYTEPTRLAETPTASIEREYVPDADLSRMNAMKALSRSATAAPVALSAEGTSAAVESTSAPTPVVESAPSSFDSGASLMPRTSREVTIDDSAPGVQDALPQPAENEPSMAPYPNPTVTPPEAIAPTEQSTPAVGEENPYR